MGATYVIVALGSTNWKTAAGTSGVTYAVGDRVVAAAVGSGSGTVSQSGNMYTTAAQLAAQNP